MFFNAEPLPFAPDRERPGARVTTVAAYSPFSFSLAS